MAEIEGLSASAHQSASVYDYVIFCLFYKFNTGTIGEVSSAVESPEKNYPQTHFATTRWSLIRNGGGAGRPSAADAGLTQLCQIYWRPIFTFIYRRGYSAQDAQDLTQDFFIVILEGTLLQSADPTRGRFRSLLIKSLKNFLVDAQVKRRTQKRGGDLQFVSWEKWMAEAPCQLSISTQTLTTSPAEALFDLSWAAAIAEEALRRLRMECESKGRRRVYEVLHRYPGYRALRHLLSGSFHCPGNAGGVGEEPAPRISQAISRAFAGRDWENGRYGGGSEG